MPGLRLLITSGATREPIDGVRYISNVSTGKTGAKLADFFINAGFEVTYLRGESSAEPTRPCQIRGFSDYRSLDYLLQSELSSKSYFAVIHLAAVSDYSVQSVLTGDRSYSPDELPKIDSGQELKLVLKPNTKILGRLKTYAREKAGEVPAVIGFKLTNTPDESLQRAAVERIAGSQDVDMIVHNDLGQIRGAQGEHRFQIFNTRAGQVIPAKVCAGVEELGAALLERLTEKL